MNKEETKKAIAVMQAYVDGKQIQYKARGGSNWPSSYINNPSWDFAEHEYRIAPVKKKIGYRRYVTTGNKIITINFNGNPNLAGELEEQSFFKEWIDLDWQVYEYEESL